MDQAYAIEYRELYQRHWWWRSREEEILRQLYMAFPEGRGNETILDVGCGDGLFFRELEKFGSVVGVEADPTTMSPNGPWQNQIHCQLFDERFQPKQRFSAILMLDILEHMPDPAAALRHARSLLAPNGILVATVPAFNGLWTSHDDLNHHHIRYTKRTFLPLIEAGGFAPMQARYLYHWTCPVKLAIRAKEAVFGAKLQPPAVPSFWINRLCLALSRIEQATLSNLPMPFGSSLMVVAKESA